MRIVLALIAAAIAGSSAWAFAPSLTLRCVHNRNWNASLRMGYIPDGLSPDEWKKIQANEKEKAANLGRVGPVRFKSRSFKAWQESGAGHLFPVDPKKVGHVNGTQSKRVSAFASCMSYFGLEVYHRLGAIS